MRHVRFAGMLQEKRGDGIVFFGKRHADLRTQQRKPAGLSELFHWRRNPPNP
jgi:hypothetical protein